VPKDLAETLLAGEEVFSGRLLKVYRDRVRLPDGSESVREYIRHPGAVMMVPMLDDRNVVLVRQYRYPLRRHFIEIPAGKIDQGETPLETAQRELREECGYVAARWQHLRTIHPCIGYSDERIELYLATELTHVGHVHDEGEFLQVVPLFEKMMVESGIILLKYWLEVDPDEQTRRLEGRIDDGRKVWKLSPMDLKSYDRWDDYTQARDEMFAATDTAWAPWHVAKSDDKKRVRLNIIAHLLSKVPYKKVPREKVKLPKRQTGKKYKSPDYPYKFIPEADVKGGRAY